LSRDSEPVEVFRNKYPLVTNILLANVDANLVFWRQNRFMIGGIGLFKIRSLTFKGRFGKLLRACADPNG